MKFDHREAFSVHVDNYTTRTENARNPARMNIQPVTKERLEREKEKRSGIFERMFANVRSVSIHRLSEMLEKAIAEGDKEDVKRLNYALSDALDDIEKMQP